MNKNTIQPNHGYLLTIFSTGLMVHVILLPNILAVAKRDAWISVLFSIIPALIFTLILVVISRQLKKESLFSFLKRHYSSSLVKFVAILFALLLFTESFITMKDTFYFIKSSYFPNLPAFFIVISFVSICFYFSSNGLKSIAITGSVFIGLVCFLGLFIAFGNIPKKDYSLLLPMFENGYSASFRGVIYVCSGVFELLFLLLLQGYSKSPITYRGTLLTAFFIIGLTLGPTSAAIAEFGHVASTTMINPAFEQWKILAFGKYFTRVDFFSIFQWLSGSFIRVSLLIFLANEVLNFKRKHLSLLSIYALMSIGILIHWNHASFLKLVQNIYFPTLTYLYVFLIMLILLLVKMKSRRKS